MDDQQHVSSAGTDLTAGVPCAAIPQHAVLSSVPNAGSLAAAELSPGTDTPTSGFSGVGAALLVDDYVDPRDVLRSLNVCICGPKSGFVGKFGAVHGPVVRGGRCQRCLDIAKASHLKQPPKASRAK